MRSNTTTMTKPQPKFFLSQLFKNAAVLDTGARGSTTTFVEREIGDVLITWENEAFLVQRQFGADKYEIVAPSLSILTEPPVAVVEDVARKHGTTEVATEYLNHLYSKEGQEIIAVLKSLNCMKQLKR